MNRQVNLILFYSVAAKIERREERTEEDKRGQRRDKSIERENQILLLSTDRMNRSIFHISLLLLLEFGSWRNNSFQTSSVSILYSNSHLTCIENTKQWERDDNGQKQQIIWLR